MKHSRISISVNYKVIDRRAVFLVVTKVNKNHVFSTDLVPEQKSKVAQTTEKTSPWRPASYIWAWLPNTPCTLLQWLQPLRYIPSRILQHGFLVMRTTADCSMALLAVCSTNIADWSRIQSKSQTPLTTVRFSRVNRVNGGTRGETPCWGDTSSKYDQYCCVTTKSTRTRGISRGLSVVNRINISK